MAPKSNNLVITPIDNGTLPLSDVKFTKWTANQPVTKQLSLADDGTINKSSTAAMLYEGTVTRLACDPAEFVEVLLDIGPNDCLSFGLPINERATKVTTSAKFEQAGRPDDQMPRTAAAMEWSSDPGILMVDYDPEETVLTPDELRDALYLCCPPLRQSAHVWATSTSSCLIDSSTNNEVRGIKGQRVYTFVADATDIPRAAKVMAKLAWINGFGSIKVSKSGSLLVRGIIDEMVFQPNRIDYCTSPICMPPLVQKKPKPELHGNPRLALDTPVALPDLTAEQEATYEQLVKAAKTAAEPAAKIVRDQYVLAHSEEYVAKGMDKADAIKMLTQALEGQVLSADYLLRSEDGVEVTVGQVLRDKDQWDGKNFCDPLEPDYHDDHRIARAYLAGPGRPVIRSFAHGACTYHLTPTTETIRLSPGDRHAYMERMATVLNDRGEFYRRGDGLVSITDDSKFSNQSGLSILSVFDRSFRFEIFVKSEKKYVPTDPPKDLALLFHAAFVPGFRPITAIITAPIIDPKTQRLISVSGYDAATGIYASMPPDVCPVIEQPTLADIEDALTLLWHCVSEFPYVESVDETVMLTAMLTAVLRPLLPTAPGFALDSPVQASGKTMLTMVLAALSGSKPTMSPWPGSRGEAEVNKAVFTKLLEGSGVIIFDNVLGEVDSPSLATVTTTETYNDRIMKEHRSGTVPTNALFLLSGNNIKLKGDLPRRFLKCRIDPKIEKPHQRIFAFHPVTWVQTHRQQMVSSALTLIKGYFAAAITSRLGSGRAGSFDVWDDCIRQTVCWLADLQQRKLLSSGKTAGGRAFPCLVDPMNAINDAIEDDPTLMQLRRLQSAWAAQVGTGYATKTTLKKLIQAHGAGMSNFTPGSVTSTESETPSLREVLAEIAGNSFTGDISAKKLGGYLSGYKNRVIDGLCLCEGDPYQGALTWWVNKVRESGDFGESDFSTRNEKSNVSQLTVAKTNSRNSPKSPKNAPSAAKAAIT